MQEKEKENFHLIMIIYLWMSTYSFIFHMLEWRVERDLFMSYTYPDRSLKGFASHMYVEIKQQSILQIRINKKCRKEKLSKGNKKNLLTLTLILIITSQFLFSFISVIYRVWLWIENN